MNQQDIIKHLKQEHDEVKELMENALSAKGAKRKKLLEKIEKELVSHSRAEEKVLYALLLKETENDKKNELRSLTNEGYEEHHAVDHILSELKQLDPDDELWEARMKVLKENVEHHIKEEENELFPKVKKQIDLEKRRLLNDQFENQKSKFEKTLPTQKQVKSRQQPAA
jgi:iron-sulfur cluster repair protein YtfE (RIC family)